MPLQEMMMLRLIQGTKQSKLCTKCRRAVANDDYVITNALYHSDRYPVTASLCDPCLDETTHGRAIAALVT
jgi:hypothetical protein